MGTNFKRELMKKIVFRVVFVLMLAVRYVYSQNFQTPTFFVAQDDYTQTKGSEKMTNKMASRKAFILLKSQVRGNNETLSKYIPNIGNYILFDFPLFFLVRRRN